MDDPRGKIDWFKEVILPHRGALRGRVRRIVRERYDLDDILAETMARAYSYDRWREVENGLAFVTRIARNILIDLERRAAVISFDLMADLDVFEQQSSHERLLTARDELRRLDAIIADLPPQARRAFILRRVEGCSISEVAVKMALSVSTVEKHLTRALTQVTSARAMQEDEGGVSALQERGTTDGDRDAGGALGRLA